MQQGEPITEELFREAYGFEEEKKKPLKSSIRDSLKCSKRKILSLLPIATWITKYDVKRDLLKDMVAGVTVAVMHIPHGLAYAPLGKVDPVVGFYMAVFPVVVYFFLGTSRHLSMGTFAVVCAMVGEVVYAHTTQRPVAYPNDQDNSTSEGPKYENIEVATAMCLMVGLWQAGLGLLQLGSFSVLLSDSFVSGFTSGAAIHVVSYQLHNLFGIDTERHTGVFKLFFLYIKFFSNLGAVNLVTMAISIICISILMFFNMYVKGILKKKFPKNKVPIPIELIIIISGLFFSYVLDLSEKFNVDIVDHVPSGFPEVQAPRADLLADLFDESLVVALVSSAVNVSLAKIFAKRGMYKVYNNHEFVAYGAANIFASFFRCLPSAASLSRTTIQFKAEGRTQVASLFSMFLIFLILLFAGPMFEPVPYCVLSSIVVVSLQGLLTQIADFPDIWKQSHWDGVVWLGTFLSVVIIGLEAGLFVGLFLSVISIAFTAHSFKVLALGRVPDTNTYLSVDLFERSQEVPKILILQIIGSMNFLNSARIAQNVLKHRQALSDGGSPEAEYVILCMSSVTKIDPTGVNELTDLHSILKQENCELYLTDCNVLVYKSFELCKMFRKIPKEQILATVSDAVEYLISTGKSNRTSES